MAFESLSQKLTTAFKKLRGKGKLSEEDINLTSTLDKNKSSFFSHNDPAMVEWFVKMVEKRKKQHDSSKENKNW